MNPIYDARTHAIDTHNVQMMQTDPRDFTRNAIRLANQLDQHRKEASAGAADAATRKALDPFAQELAQRPPDYDGYVIPHQYTYAGVYNTYKKFYYYYFDEALRNNYQNALAMRRDGMIQELLRHRQLPTVSLDYHIVPDDPDDKAQQDVAKQVTKVIERTARYQSLKLWLLEWIFYGKSGVQTRWGKRKIDGVERRYINGFTPIEGDKIVYKWDGTPGVLIYSGSGFTQRPDVEPYVDYSNIGPTFFLYNPDYRKRFIIGEFEASDFDYLFEQEKAAATHGIGLRDRFYWMWNTYVELMSWQMDAMQRVGANGMLYAFFQANDPQSELATMMALKQLVKENVSAFPLQPGESPSSPVIHNIAPASVGYDVMYQMMEYFAGIITRGFVGQNLSSQSAPTGLGSGVAELHADTFEHYILYDSKCLEEVLDSQQLQPTLHFNIWDYKGQKLRGDQLPFGLQYKLQLDRKNVKELIEAAKTLHDMGVLLDAEDLRDKAGLSAPKNKSTAVALPGGATGGADNASAIAATGLPPGRNRPPRRLSGGVKTPPRSPGGSQTPSGGPQNGKANGKVPDQYAQAPPAPEAGGGQFRIRLTFTPRVREGRSLFSEWLEWAIGDDDRPAIFLKATPDGNAALYVWDDAIADYELHRLYQPQEETDALRDARSMAAWIAKQDQTSEVVTTDDITTFNHQLFHKLHREAFDVRAKVVGAPGPGVDCWVERLTNVHDSEFAPPRELTDAIHTQTPPTRKGDPGVMIALMVPRDSEAFRIGQTVADTDQSDELHITLAYLGRLSEIPADMLADAEAAVAQIAEAYGPLSGTLKGVGRFPATDSSEGRDVLYWTPDVPGLEEFRADLCAMLNAARIPYKKNFKFHPHVTLAYTEPGMRPSIRQLNLGVQGCPVTFPSLALIVGGRAREYPFGDRLNSDPHSYMVSTNGHELAVR